VAESRTRACLPPQQFQESANCECQSPNVFLIWNSPKKGPNHEEIQYDSSPENDGRKWFQGLINCNLTSLITGFPPFYLQYFDVFWVCHIYKHDQTILNQAFGCQELANAVDGCWNIRVLAAPQPLSPSIFLRPKPSQSSMFTGQIPIGSWWKHLKSTPICNPWCWYIYLQNWLILFGKCW
jgi:hypothetical protein